MTALLLNANALHIPLADESVQCVITSPPYYGLRDYGTAKWIGGDSACDHKPGACSRVGKTTLAGGKNHSGHLHEGYKGVCAKCGALRADHQLGLEPTPEAYVENLVNVFREIWRVLHPAGTVWLVIGDSYWGDSPVRKSSAEAFSKQWDKSLTRSRGGTRRSAAREDEIKPKDLIMIPARVALALQADGWYLRSENVWNKLNPMPESMTDRPTRAHEMIYLLAKSGKTRLWRARDTGEWSDDPDLHEVIARRKWRFAAPESQAEQIEELEDEYEQAMLFDRTAPQPDAAQAEVTDDTLIKRWKGFDYYYDADAIAEPAQAWEGRAGTFERSGPVADHVLPGQSAAQHRKGRNGKNAFRGQGAHRDAETGKANREGRDLANVGTSPTRNKRSVWTVSVKPYRGAHFATFPPDLVEPMILAGTRPGDLVLDPFSGTATVGQVALQHRRRFVGLELNPKYIDLARERLSNLQVSLL